MQLKKFSNKDFSRGRSSISELMWLITQWLFVSSWQPFNGLRVAALRLFGAEIGQGVILKPRLRVKFPWRLKVADYVWLGESVWIDNLAPVTIGSNSCISQGAYLCTGSHDAARSTFDLITRPIVIEDQVWVCAKSVVLPGAVLHSGSLLTAASVAKGELAAWSMYSGNPAVKIGRRSEQETAT